MVARRTVGKSIESSTVVTVELMRVVKTLLSIEFSRDFLLDESSKGLLACHFGKFPRQLGKN